MAEIRRIVTEEDPLLHEKSVEVKRFSVSLYKLLDDMRATMYHENGVGIAAPQVGILKKVAVIDDQEHPYIELVNPKIVERYGKCESTEFCLSVPSRGGKVPRAKEIKVEYQDRDGKEYTIDVSGHLAIIFQHEIDHLNGILFTDIMTEEISREDAYAEADSEDLVVEGKEQ